jgi:hypothetical protein
MRRRIDAVIGNDLRGLNLQAGVPQDLVGDGDDGVAALDLGVDLLGRQPSSDSRSSWAKR